MGVTEVVCIIPLTQEKFAIIDPEDYEMVSQHMWYAVERKRGCWYSATTINGFMYMHTFLTGFVQTDHRNNNGLDNRRVNLREATFSQNNANRRKNSGCISSFKGVSRHQNTSKWRAYIRPGFKQIHLGYFDQEVDAARAYDEAAIRIYGEFAKTNKTLGLLS